MFDISTLHQWVASYGYWVLAIGCLLEGETILVLAGFAAHRGDLDPALVWIIAAIGGFAGDQILFWLGRYHGAWVMCRWPSLTRHADRIQKLQKRYHAAMIIGVRFAYGLRLAGPTLIGASGISGTRFLVFNAIGALIWATLVGGAGWVFGEAAEAVLGEMQQLEGWVLAGLVAGCFTVGCVLRARARAREG